MSTQDLKLFDPDRWFSAGNGPRYLQFYRYLADSIRAGTLAADTQLPPERVLAKQADISRVTVRKSVELLAEEGLLEQRQGSGSYVRAGAPRLEQSLSTLISFTENLQLRGQVASSVVLSQGFFIPTNDEVMALGLSPSQRVARIKRLRSADDTPMAIEESSLPGDILSDPSAVKSSLYEILRKNGRAPVRAVQRVTARNLRPEEAELLRMGANDAVLHIERTGYLAHGRPIELTRGLYRSDIYDFVSELRLDSEQ